LWSEKPGVEEECGAVQVGQFYWNMGESVLMSWGEEEELLTPFS